MIVNVSGIVLSRRVFGEFDRVCSVFTEDLGKIPVRFVGVNRAKGKMKALSEPGVWGEYRLHLSSRSEFAKAVGGRLVSSFPDWRKELDRTIDALTCLDMLDRLTASHQASPEKFKLICAFLHALENAPNGWIVPAFGLRLAVILGISLNERSPASCRAVWPSLHHDEPSSLSRIGFDSAAAEAARLLLDTHFTAHAGRRLRIFEFCDAWAQSAAQGVRV